MHNRNNEFEYLKYTFDNINTWINNVDNKISILLAFFAAIIGYVFSIKEKISMNHINLFIIGILIGVLVCGCLLCFLALKGRIKSKINYNSMIFFGSISEMDRKDYYDRLSRINEKQSINDIKNQIYINSCICSKKFKLYNLALDCLIIAIFLISLVHIINFFICI